MLSVIESIVKITRIVYLYHNAHNHPHYPKETLVAGCGSGAWMVLLDADEFDE